MNDDNNLNPFNNFNPYDLLEELARQNAELNTQFQLMIKNQHALAAAVNDQHSQIEQQTKKIQQMQLLIFNYLRGIENEKENTRPTR
jgi:hypothetical protein